MMGGGVTQEMRGSNNPGKSVLRGFQPPPPAHATPSLAIRSSGILLSNYLQYKINTVYALTVAKVTY